MTQIELDYQEYLRNYDPTPQYGGEYREPMSFDTFEWLSIEEEEEE